MKFSFVALASAVPAISAVEISQGAEADSAANPIRKVVTLLQKMQKKVAAEGEKADDLYEKYMCYCKTSGGDLQASIDAADNKLPQLESSIKAATSQNTQLQDDVKSHQVDRAAAKKTMAEATAIRTKEKAAFDKALAENKANLAAASKAVTAVSQGMSGSFLQTTAASALRAFVTDRQDMSNGDRNEILAFLSGNQEGEYAPASGEIVGILKTMVDEMTKDQKDMIATEDDAVKSYNELIAAKEKEIAVLQKSLETKMKRIGELGVEIATMKGDLSDTAEALAEDQKFIADMKKNCAERTGIHEEEQKMRAQETVALADTIKILNDDDALELFKKTLPSASASFVQVQDAASALRAHASNELSNLQGSHPRLDFVLLALHGKKVGFDKIVKLIDDMVVLLKKEQQDDNDKKEYCAAQFDEADDKKKGLERSVADLETKIADTKEGIATLTEEIAALKSGIVALDKSLAEATAQRQAENAEYKDLMASNGAAKELILFAKNRLNKFYNPKLHKAAPKRELSEGDRIFVNEGGDIPTEAPGGIANTGISLLQVKDAPAPPPATAAAYTKKAGEAGGVLSMMDLLVADLDKEMTEADVEEKNDQKEYEQVAADSADKRRQDSKSLTDKEAAKAGLESSLQESKDSKKQDTRSLMGTDKYISELHAECDWLLKYFDVRAAARADEISALGNAKAVLSGADYSLIQSTRATKFLKRGYA